MLKLQRVRDDITEKFFDEEIVSETFLYSIYKMHSEHHE